MVQLGRQPLNPAVLGYSATPPGGLPAVPSQLFHMKQVPSHCCPSYGGHAGITMALCPRPVVACGTPNPHTHHGQARHPALVTNTQVRWGHHPKVSSVNISFKTMRVFPDVTLQRHATQMRMVCHSQLVVPPAALIMCFTLLLQGCYAEHQQPSPRLPSCCALLGHQIDD